MIKKINITLLFIAMISIMGLEARISLAQVGNSLIVSTSEVGFSGFRTCTDSDSKPVDAYIHTLYKKTEVSKNSCHSNASKWEKIKEVYGSMNSVLFDSLENGQYKAVIYSGLPLGCDLSFDPGDLPNKAIVYQQEESEFLSFQNTESDMNLSDHSLTYKNNLLVSPNPAMDQIYLSFDIKDEARLEDFSILDLHGREMNLPAYKEENSSSANYELDTSSIPNGTYFLIARLDNGEIYHHKIIIVK